MYIKTLYLDNFGDCEKETEFSFLVDKKNVKNKDLYINVNNQLFPRYFGYIGENNMGTSNIIKAINILVDFTTPFVFSNPISLLSERNNAVYNYAIQKYNINPEHLTEYSAKESQQAMDLLSKSNVFNNICYVDENFNLAEISFLLQHKVKKQHINTFINYFKYDFDCHLIIPLQHAWATNKYHKDEPTTIKLVTFDEVSNKDVVWEITDKMNFSKDVFTRPKLFIDNRKPTVAELKKIPNLITYLDLDHELKMRGTRDNSGATKKTFNVFRWFLETDDNHKVINFIVNLLAMVDPSIKGVSNQEGIIGHIDTWKFLIKDDCFVSLDDLEHSTRVFLTIIENFMMFLKNDVQILFVGGLDGILSKDVYRLVFDIFNQLTDYNYQFFFIAKSDDGFKEIIDSSQLCYVSKQNYRSFVSETPVSVNRAQPFLLNEFVDIIKKSKK